MPVTKIRLRDGIVDDDGRRIDRLTLQLPKIRDALLLRSADNLPGALKLLASLSGVPESALTTMTMDDAVIAFDQVCAHIEANDPKRGGLPWVR